jgi:hypothetical protein
MSSTDESCAEPSLSSGLCVIQDLVWLLLGSTLIFGWRSRCHIYTHAHDIAFLRVVASTLTCRGSLDIGMAYFIACHCRAQCRGRLQESWNAYLGNVYPSVRRVNLSEPAATCLDNRRDDIRSNENRNL